MGFPPARRGLFFSLLWSISLPLSRRFCPYGKKSYQHLLARPSLNYQFIAEHQEEYPVTLMCQVLEVSVSGYYASRQRPVSHHQREDARLCAEIQTIFLENRQVYGSPRIHAALQARGMRCGRKRVVRLMQALGLQAKRHRQHKPSTTSSDPTAR